MNMTEAEAKQHIDAAEKSPKQIATAVSGLPDRVLRYQPAPDKWCIVEILAHLADVEVMIAAVDQDDRARHLGYMEKTPAELVALYG
jgi:hypothetical protein